MSERSETDKKIFEAYVKGGREAGFEELYSAYFDRIFFFLINLSANAAEAADLSQEVFLKAYEEKGIENYNIKAWLYRVATNSFYMMKRSYYSRLRYFFRNAFRFVEGGTDPADEFVSARIAEEAGTALRKCLGKLEERDRAVLVMKYYDGMSCEEIADIAGVEPGTVMSRLSRARERMREMMENDGK